ncbi:alkanesulfonate monooxygenase SsuD/methylene tetrahydromethanopterin reductase-like flavin-dependent oxidoreductase (luciferase family) [Streptomyces sp. SAI-144]|nr:alkanesulfonate monooxygenase SsuD/methylene tetrahydromethanopterin reductase-like flavin-dependent oxidoreductase (luciferase family) [Streptomyces sp. SAI-144]
MSGPTRFGLPFERPIARLREFLTALRQLTETGTADFHGEPLTATTPIPARVPGAESGIPLLVAAMGPQALRVSGELADGILPYLGGPRALAEHIIPALTAAAAAAGRPAPRIVALVPGVVTDDVDAVRAQATENLAFYKQISSYPGHRALRRPTGRRPGRDRQREDSRGRGTEVSGRRRHRGRVLGHRDRGRDGPPTHLGTPRRTRRLSTPVGPYARQSPRPLKENP